MKTKEIYNDYGFNDIIEFFDYIIESKINGNFSQVKELLTQLDEFNKIAFLNYILNQLDHNSKDFIYLNEQLILTR